MITKTKPLIPILLGALATIVTPLIFCTVMVIMTGGRELPHEFILLTLGILSLVNLLAYLAYLLLYRKLGLPLTSFRLIVHGVTAMLTLVALGIVLSLSRGFFVNGIPGFLLLMFGIALLAFLLSTLLQFLAQTLITRTTGADPSLRN